MPNFVYFAGVSSVCLIIGFALWGNRGLHSCSVVECFFFFYGVLLLAVSEHVVPVLDAILYIVGSYVWPLLAVVSKLWACIRVRLCVHLVPFR